METACGTGAFFARDPLRALHLAPFAVMFALPAMAQDSATADAITAAISGNTVQGSMTTSGACTEFHGADRGIKGKDCTGFWTLEADKMCFAHGTDPATCCGMRLTGDQVTWVGASGDEGRAPFCQATQLLVEQHKGASNRLP